MRLTTPERNPDWFLEENELYEHKSNYEPSPTTLHSNFVAGQNNSNSRTTNVNRPSTNETLPLWTKEDSDLLTDDSKVDLDENEFCLTRSYAEISKESSPPLVKSHPCSTYFLEFIGQKLLVLLIALFVITLQNFLTYPTMLGIFNIAYIDQDLELFLYCLVSIILVPIRLAWIIYIFDVSF